jgi:hypothetical protein
MDAISTNSSLPLYQTEDGQTKIEVRLQGETVWLNQAQMSELFDKDRRTVGEHIQNIFTEKELEENAVCRKFRQAANQYLAVLNKIGDPRNKYDPENISKLCAHNCKKVRNGETLFEQKAHFADQLISGKEWLGSWSIHPLEILAIPDSNSAVIRYELTTEKEGRLLVFVILKFDENLHIYEINEVHNKIHPT